MSKLAVSCEWVRQFLRPAISSFIEVYLQFLSTIDADELFTAFRHIIQAFKKEIAPFAHKIVVALIEQFTMLQREALLEKNSPNHMRYNSRIVLGRQAVLEAIKHIIKAVKTDRYLLGILR
jgi:hypothetical protein